MEGNMAYLGDPRRLTCLFARLLRQDPDLIGRLLLACWPSHPERVASSGASHTGKQNGMVLTTETRGFVK